jgi:hypothetical protein
VWGIRGVCHTPCFHLRYSRRIPWHLFI